MNNLVLITKKFKAIKQAQILKHSNTFYWKVKRHNLQGAAPIFIRAKTKGSLACLFARKIKLSPILIIFVSFDRLYHVQAIGHSYRNFSVTKVTINLAWYAKKKQNFPLKAYYMLKPQTSCFHYAMLEYRTP